jgi:hypothetical protein
MPPCSYNSHNWLLLQPWMSPMQEVCGCRFRPAAGCMWQSYTDCCMPFVVARLTPCPPSLILTAACVAPVARILSLCIIATMSALMAPFAAPQMQHHQQQQQQPKTLCFGVQGYLSPCVLGSGPMATVSLGLLL